jgi:hypothetical protein
METVASNDTATNDSANKLRTLWALADRQLRRPVFAYLSIALLQLIAVWGMWEHRELTRGDTASYFLDAWGWYEKKSDNIAWSPLYTSFYGSMLFVSSDPVVATVLHRLVLVFTASLLVLAVFRRILPAAVAWLMAAWWTVLPINFGTLYEVHLFAVIPVLVCWWLVAARDGPWNRGAALGVLAGATILVRNELSVAAMLFACVCVWREWPRIRSALPGTRLRRVAILVAAYCLPLMGSGYLVYKFYQHSVSRFDTPGLWNLNRILRSKHELNMAQVFAFGYLQRHPDWEHDPWVDYKELMNETFGKELISFSEMIRVNPIAVLQHVGWNFRLVPNGLQVLLFDGTSGRSNPDYIPVHTHSPGALYGSIAMLIVWGTGITLLIRGGRAELVELLRGQGTTWLAMLCVTVIAIPVIATQRPRPSYLFSLSVLIMAFTGLCLTVILRRFKGLRFGASLLPVILLIAYYVSPLHPGLQAKAAPTPLRDTIHRLQPFQHLFIRADTRSLAGVYSYEISSYVGHGISKSFGHDWLCNLPADQSLEAYLQTEDINLVYLDEIDLQWLEANRPEAARAFLKAKESPWKLIGSGDVPGIRWRLYQLQRPNL